MLRSNSIQLKELSQEDSPVIFEWINDRETVLYNSPYKPISEIQHKTWFENIQNRNDIFIFGIYEIKTDKIIGTCQLHSINWIHRNAELQIRLGNKGNRGKGYGSEAVRLLLDFAFRDLNLYRIYLHVFQTNTNAIHVYEKVGFKKEGLLRKAAHIDGKYVDVIFMGILREEYEK